MDEHVMRHFYAEVLENMLEGCQILGFDWRYIFINQAARVHNRRRDEDLTGRHYVECWPGVEHTEVYTRLKACMEERVQQNLENHFVFPDGGTGWYDLRIYPVPEGIFIMSIDTTERHAQEERLHATEEQLRQSQKLEAVGQLAGGVAHDFNNILSVILGYSHVLLDELGKEHPLTEEVEQIIQAGERAATLTRQLLAFSRKQILQPEVVDINEVVRGTWNLLSRLLGENIQCTLKLAPFIRPVKVDPGQIGQVIVNLCVNARDAMPGGGTLILETGVKDLDPDYTLDHAEVACGSYVMLAITDTGCGMPEDVCHRIFEPFYTTKGKGKGTGLGLSMVYGIVKQSGGYIYVYSEPGKGTTFKVYLPAVSAQISTRRAKAAGALRGQGERVLVVEDDESLRGLLNRMLVDLGYQVALAHGPLHALALVFDEGVRPHVLLTDVVMPDMGGAALAARLREHLPNLPVVYMSGYTDNAIVHQGVLDEGIPFIEKPFTVVVLSQKLREVLDPPL